MTWILILMLTSNGRPAATSIEFHNQQACLSALQSIEDRWGKSGNYTICVRKG
jgi:hypothetical protein